MRNVRYNLRIGEKGLPIGYRSVNSRINRKVYENIEFNLWRIFIRFHAIINRVKE